MILEKGKGYVPQFYIPTPSLLLNSKLSQGGIPSGMIMQFQSEKPGSFKSSMALQMLGYAQKQGLNTAYIELFTVGKGKKMHDKRQDIKEREAKREISRAMSRRK